MAAQVFNFEQVENLNQLIVQLYEQDLPVHTRISNFFHGFINFVYFDRASVLLYYKDENGDYHKKTSITINWDLDLLKKYDSYLYRTDDTLKPLDRPEPIVIKSSSYFNETARQETKFWKEYMIPNNAFFEVVANLQLDYDKKIRANLSFTRGKESKDFTNDDIRIVRMFQPHLTAVVRQYIDQLVESNELLEMQNYNCIGYCILDENCQVIKSNGIFERLNQSVNNKLINKIIHLSVAFDSNVDSRNALTYEYKFEDEPLFLELTRSPSALDGSKMQYCCLVYNLAYFFTSTLKQSKSKYGLSSREYEILVCILQGLKQEDIAQKLFLSVPSVKKYVASIYSKMGITNQKQIFAKLNLL